MCRVVNDSAYQNLLLEEKLELRKGKYLCLSSSPARVVTFEHFHMHVIHLYYLVSECSCSYSLPAFKISVGSLVFFLLILQVLFT